jgi:thyrotropin-releasing hormone receptor
LFYFSILTAIAFWDMGLMGSYFVWGLVPVCHPVFFSYWWNVYTMCYANFSVVAHSASLWSTVLMAALRVMILRNSQRASANFDNVRTALMAIGAACALAILGSIPNFLRNHIIDYGITRMPLECYPTNSSQRRMHIYSLEQPAWWSCTWERANFWITGVLFKIIPCILLTVFMTMLVHMLLEAGRRRQRMLRDRTNQSSLTTLHTDRTTKMLVLIMLVFLV